MKLQYRLVAWVLLTIAGSWWVTEMFPKGMPQGVAAFAVGNIIGLWLLYMAPRDSD